MSFNKRRAKYWQETNNKFVLLNKNKRGVLGEIIITFIATIVIIIILALFSLASAVLKAANTNKAFEGVQMNNPKINSDVENYMNSSFSNFVALRNLMIGDEEGEFKTFFGAMKNWNKGNLDKVMDSAANFKPAYGVLYAGKGDAGSFYCEVKNGINTCIECKQNICDFINVKKYSYFRLSPLNVELKLI